VRRPPSAPLASFADLFGPGLRDPRASLKNERLLLTYSGRGAIYLYLAALRQGRDLDPRRSVVLAPAFHCPTVIDPILHAGFDIRYYSIDQHLRPVPGEFLSLLDNSVAAALFIRYFGLTPAELDLHASVRQSGARVIEDCCHSFLEGEPVQLVRSGADATIYSFYKLAPIAHGGGLLLGERDENLGVALRRTPIAGQWGAARAFATQCRQSFVERVAERGRPVEHPRHVELEPVVQRSAAEAYPYDSEKSGWEIPSVSQRLLRRTAWEPIAAARRRNYRLLLSTFPADPRVQPLLSEDPQDNVPWGFPVIAQERSAIDYRIRASGVPVYSFGETLHPHMTRRAGAEVAMRALELSRAVFVISIHQQISPQVVGRFPAMIQKVLST
jgi:perosamine synthetase